MKLPVALGVRCSGTVWVLEDVVERLRANTAKCLAIATLCDTLV